MSQEVRHIPAATSNKPFTKVVFLLCIISAALWIISFFPDLVLILILSLLIAFVLRPVVIFLEFRFGIKRRLAVSIVFIFLLGTFIMSGIFLLPLAMDRLKLLYDSFKNFPFDQKLNEAAVSFTSGIPFLDPETVTLKVHEIVDGGFQELNNILTSVAGFAVNLFIVPFITFFMLAEGDAATKKVIERVPNKYFEMTLNVIYKIKTELIGYLSGWILDSVIVGILNIAAFYFIGVDYAIIFGIIAGVSNLIPYVGPFFGVIPPLLFSLSQYGDFRQAAMIVAFSLVIVQVIDNLWIQPFCFSKTVDMHPVTVIVVLIIGNSVMGVAGMLLAIPIATILKESAIETYWGLKNYRITT